MYSKMLKVENEKIIVLSVVSYVGPLLDKRMSVASARKQSAQENICTQERWSEQFILHNAFYALISYIWTADNFCAYQGCGNANCFKVRLKCLFEVVTFHICFSLFRR